MRKNYDVLHYIQQQLSSYDVRLSNAIQRLFIFEDTREECQGCVIDSVVALLLFKKYGVSAELHLGEACVDKEWDMYHCWLTVDGKIFDLGIYGNSHYNEVYHGSLFKYPVIFDNPEDLIYCDGSTEDKSWLASLSGKAISDYIKGDPLGLTETLFYYALDISNDKSIYDLAEGLSFPILKHIDVSPSGRFGLTE